MTSLTLLVLSILCLSEGSHDIYARCGDMPAEVYVPIRRIYCVQLQDMDWNYATASAEQEEGHHEEEEEEDQDDDRVYDLTQRFEDNAEYQLSEDKPKLGKYAMRGYLQLYQYSVGTDDVTVCDWNTPMETENSFRDGILGPTIRGVVGDTIEVNFYNNAYTVYVASVEVDDGDDDEQFLIDATFNIIPQGVEADHTTSIGYLDTTTYTWTVGQDAHTSSASTTLWTYMGYVIEDNGIAKDAYNFNYDSGVFGPLVVVDPRFIMDDSYKESAFPCDIDEEVNVAFLETQEANNIYYKWNLHDFFEKKYHDKYRDDAEHSIPNTKRSVNGHMYGNMNFTCAASTRMRYNIIVQNTTLNWVPKEDEHQDEHQDEEEEEFDYEWGPITGWSNITVDMGFPIDGLQVFSFDGSSTQTLDYQCNTSGNAAEVRLIDVAYFNEFGVSAYMTVFPPVGGETWDHDEVWNTGQSDGVMDAGAITGLVFGVFFALVLCGVCVMCVRNRGKDKQGYGSCLDDSTSEMIELNVAGNSSGDQP